MRMWHILLGIFILSIIISFSYEGITGEKYKTLGERFGEFCEKHNMEYKHSTSFFSSSDYWCIEETDNDTVIFNDITIIDGEPKFKSNRNYKEEKE